MSPPAWVGISILIFYFLALPLYVPLWRSKSHRNMSDLRFYHFLGHVAGAAFIAHEYLLSASYTTPLTYSVQCASWIFIYVAISKKILVVLRHSPRYSCTMGKIFLVVLTILLLCCGAATITFSTRDQQEKVIEAAYSYVVVGFACVFVLSGWVYHLNSSYASDFENSTTTSMANFSATSSTGGFDGGDGSSFHHHQAPSPQHQTAERKLFSRHTNAAVYTDLIVAGMIPAYTLARQLVANADTSSNQLSDDAVIAALFCEAVLFTTQFCLHVFFTWQLSTEQDKRQEQQRQNYSGIMSGLSDTFIPRYGTVEDDNDYDGHPSRSTGSLNNDLSNALLPGKRSAGGSTNSNSMFRGSSRSNSNSNVRNQQSSTGNNNNQNNNVDDESAFMIVTDSDARNDMQREHVRLRKPFLSALNNSSPFSMNFYLNRFTSTYTSTSYEEFKEVLFKECSNGSTDIARQLVESRDPQQRGWTLIHFAAAKRNVEALKVIYHELYSSGSDRVAFSVVDSYGLAPLHLAVLGIDSDSSSNTMASSSSNQNNQNNNNNNNANSGNNNNNSSAASKAQQFFEGAANRLTRSGSQPPAQNNNNNNNTNSNQQSSNSTSKSSLVSPTRVTSAGDVRSSDFTNAYPNQENNNNNNTTTGSSAEQQQNQQNLTPYDIEINNACAAIRFLCSVVKVDAGAVAGHGDGRNALHLAIMRNADIRIIRELVKANISVTTLAERYSVAPSTTNVSGKSRGNMLMNGGGGAGASAGGGAGSARSSLGGGAGGSQQDDSKSPDTLPTNPWFHHFVSQLDYNGKSAMVLAIETNNWDAVSVMLSSATGGNMKDSSSKSTSLPPIGSQSSMMNYCLRSNPPSALRCGKCRNAPLLHIAMTAGASHVVRGMLKGACEFVMAQHQQRAQQQKTRLAAAAAAAQQQQQQMMQISINSNSQNPEPSLENQQQGNNSNTNSNNNVLREMSASTILPGDRQNTNQFSSTNDLASPPNGLSSTATLPPHSPNSTVAPDNSDVNASPKQQQQPQATNTTASSMSRSTSRSNSPPSQLQQQQPQFQNALPLLARTNSLPPLQQTTSNNNNNNKPASSASLISPSSNQNNNNTQQQTSTPFPSWGRALHKSVKDSTWSSRPGKGLNIFHCAAMGDVCPSVLVDLVRILAPPVFYVTSNNNNSSTTGSGGPPSYNLGGNNDGTTNGLLSLSDLQLEGSTSLNNTLNNTQNNNLPFTQTVTRTMPNTPIGGSCGGNVSSAACNNTNSNCNSNNNSPPSCRPSNPPGTITNPSSLDRELHKILYRIKLWKDLTCVGFHNTASFHRLSHQHQQLLAAQFLTPQSGPLNPLLSQQLQQSSFALTSSTTSHPLGGMITPKLGPQSQHATSSKNLISPIRGGSGSGNYQNQVSNNNNATSDPTSNLTLSPNINNNNSRPQQQQQQQQQTNNNQHHHQHPRCPSGDGIPSLAWLHLWEHRFSRIGLHSCAKHLTDLTKSSVEYLKKNDGGKLVQRIGNAALSVAAANEIIDAAEKFKIRELGQFVSDWLQLGEDKARARQPARAQDILSWSVHNRHYLEQQHSFLFRNNKESNSNCADCAGNNNTNNSPSPNAAEHLLTPSSSEYVNSFSNNNVVNMNNNNPLIITAADGFSFASNASSAIMMQPTDSLQTNQQNSSASYGPENFLPLQLHQQEQQQQQQSALPNTTTQHSQSAPNHHALANNNNNNSTNIAAGNRRPRTSSLSPQQQNPYQQQQQQQQQLSRENTVGSLSSGGASPPLQQPLSLTTEKKKALDRLGKVASIADVLDFVVGAKIGQVGPSYVPSTSAGGFPQSGGGSVQSVPSFVRTASYGALDGGNNNNNKNNQNLSGPFSGAIQNGNKSNEEEITDKIKSYISREEKEMENLIEIRRMLRARAAYYGIKNTEIDPQFTPIEIAFHRCHFPMFLALIVLDEAVDHILSKKRREIRRMIEDMWDNFDHLGSGHEGDDHEDSAADDRNSSTSTEEHAPPPNNHSFGTTDPTRIFNPTTSSSSANSKSITNAPSSRRQSSQSHQSHPPLRRDESCGRDGDHEMAVNDGGSRGGTPANVFNADMNLAKNNNDNNNGTKNNHHNNRSLSKPMMPNFEILGDSECDEFSPRLASASLRESSALAIEPLREEILEQLAIAANF